MVTITLVHPTKQFDFFQVFGMYEGTDDCFVFGAARFPPHKQEQAEKRARRLMESHKADHFERIWKERGA